MAEEKKAVAGSGSLAIDQTCGTGCGATNRAPAYEDRFEKDPARRLKPVAPHPYVCLPCWRAGWRSVGPLDNAGTWTIERGETIIKVRV